VAIYHLARLLIAEQTLLEIRGGSHAQIRGGSHVQIQLPLVQLVGLMKLKARCLALSVHASPCRCPVLVLPGLVLLFVVPWVDEHLAHAGLNCHDLVCSELELALDDCPRNPSHLSMMLRILHFEALHAG